MVRLNNELTTGRPELFFFFLSKSVLIGMQPHVMRCSGPASEERSLVSRTARVRPVFSLLLRMDRGHTGHFFPGLALCMRPIVEHLRGASLGSRARAPGSHSFGILLSVQRFRNSPAMDVCEVDGSWM